MHITILRPPPKSLPLEVKQNPKQTPQQYKRRICHNRGYVTILLNPIRNKLAKPVPPNILVHRDGHEQTARHRFVAVNRVR